MITSLVEYVLLLYYGYASSSVYNQNAPFAGLLVSYAMYDARIIISTYL